MSVYGNSYSEQFRCIMTAIDTSSKIRWCIPLKNKNRQTVKDDIPNLITSSKRKSSETESDRGKESFEKNINN